MAGSSYTYVIGTVDDFYFSALHDDEDLFPICDHKYAEELQFQEVLMSSLLLSSSSSHPHRPRHHHLFPSNTHALLPRTRRTITPASSSSSSSSSSSGKGSFCEICAEPKTPEEMFRTDSCPHSFCNVCVARHIAVKVQENIAAVRCPAAGCDLPLEPALCRAILPGEVFGRWEDALCESMVLAAERFYCPYMDCSAFFVVDDEGGGRVGQSECPSCWRLFCARCGVPWHAGVECKEYQRLGDHERAREDLMVMELAKSKRWKRCPRCRFYVEKSDGCLHITCRCGYQFCYGCGAAWGNGVHSGGCNGGS